MRVWNRFFREGVCYAIWSCSPKWRGEQQSAKPYEIKLGGRNRSEDLEQDRALMKSLAEVGVTCWVEYVPAGELVEMRESVKRGPIRIE